MILIRFLEFIKITLVAVRKMNPGAAGGGECTLEAGRSVRIFQLWDF